MIQYLRDSEAAFVHRLCIPTEPRSGIELVVANWAEASRLAAGTETDQAVLVTDERQRLWRTLLDALCNWAGSPISTIADANALIHRAEYLGDRWRAFGFTYDGVVDQIRLMHVVLHDAFRSWTYDESWLGRFERGYTVVNLAAILGFARVDLEESGRYDETSEQRRADYRKFLGVL